MRSSGHMMRAVLIWSMLIAALAFPLFISLTSPLLAWRDPIYIIAGFAGVLGLAILLLQPLLIGGYLPIFRPRDGRKAHMWLGCLLLAAIIIHVGGLYLTSPPDVIDALLLRSPTAFSIWGVVAMAAVFITALLVFFRRSLRLNPLIWRKVHVSLAIVIVVGTIVHAWLIDGTMGTISKAILCAMVIAVLVKIIIDRDIFSLGQKRRRT